MQEPRGVSLESGYSTDLSVPIYRVQENHPARSLRHQEECKYCTSSTTGRGTDRERCKESASVIGGTGRRSATSAQPGNPKEPGLLEVVGDSRSDEREHCVFYLIFENDCQRARFRKDVGRCRRMIWRLRETIPAAELAAKHRLGQMRRLQVHEKHKAWKREFGFDRIETAAEMDEKCFRTIPAPFQIPTSIET